MKGITVPPTFGFSNLSVKGEDRMIISNFKDIYICGIYDGHGGDTVVKYVEKYLVKYFLKSKKVSINLKIKDAYLRIEKELKQNKIINSGTTASTLIITPDYIHICHIGDSRIICIKNKKIKQLTIDHKPNESRELTRILRTGDQLRFTGVHRIGPLAVSRSIGDLRIKQQYKSISHTPDVKKLKNINFPLFIIASDGLFDVMTNTNVILFIIKRINKISLKKIADELVNFAKKKGSNDDISVIIVKN